MNKKNLRIILLIIISVYYIYTEVVDPSLSYTPSYNIEEIPEYAEESYVIINNKKCNIIGNICMDSCMIDVTEIDNVKVDDDVYIWDNDLITVEEIATLCDTINYEIISTISNRVERVFID